MSASIYRARGKRLAFADHLAAIVFERRVRFSSALSSGVGSCRNYSDLIDHIGMILQ
jgi:hypothetical protein